jgi:tetratricopeptide (TPR) repeat protein
MTLELEEEMKGGTDLEQIKGLYYLRGSAYVRLGQADKAAHSFQREIELFPAELPAYTRLAVIYKLMDRMEDAHRTIDQLVRTNPEPAAYAEGTRALRMLGEDQRAWRLLREGLELWPSDRELLELTRVG